MRQSFTTMLSNDWGASPSNEQDDRTTVRNFDIGVPDHMFRFRQLLTTGERKETIMGSCEILSQAGQVSEGQ